MPTFQENVEKARKMIVQNMDFIKRVAHEEVARVGLEFFRAKLTGKSQDELSIISARAEAAVLAIEWCEEAGEVTNENPFAARPPMEEQSRLTEFPRPATTGLVESNGHPAGKPIPKPAGHVEVRRGTGSAPAIQEAVV